jgi:hypothetical protein
MVAPIIPELAAGNNSLNIVSQQVAPRDMEALRKSTGTDINTSRLMAATVGKIIIDNSIPAGSIPGPKGSLLNRGNQLNLSNNNCCNGNKKGIKTKIPHRPTITLGIAAINSTRNPKGDRTQTGKKFSLVTIATDSPNGSAMIMPIAELITVP